MKKSALALAVAAALVGSVAYADTTLYGSARVSVDYNDVDDFKSPHPNLKSYLTGGEDYWDVWNNASRLGVRGEEDLGGGLAAIYQYEFGVDVTEGGNFVDKSYRPKWAGLKGGFGAITLGTQWTPYYNVIGVGDIFNSSKSFNRDAYLGSDYGLRMDNSIIYTTPNLSGFSAQAMLVVNGTCPPNDPKNSTQLCRSIDANNVLPENLSDNVDMWDIGLTYKNGPFFVGATYMALEGPSFKPLTITNPANNRKQPSWTGDANPEGDQWGLAVGYNSGPFAVSLSYEDGDVNRLFPDDTQNYYLTGQYTFGPHVIRAAYGFADPDGNDFFLLEGTGDNKKSVKYKVDDINTYLFGYQYNFSKRTRLWAEYLGRNSDSFWGDANIFSIGTRVDF